MASTVQFSHSLQDQAGLPNYEQLKEEHDMGILEAPGVPPGATVVRMHSAQARDRKVIGDYNSAASYGSTAKCLNLVALLLNILSVVAAIVVIVVLASK